MICSDDIAGFDGGVGTLIPLDFGGAMVSRNRTQSSSILELGKKLLQASREGDEATVVDLMSKGAPFTADWLGTSPLHLAAMNNHMDTCDILLRAGIGKDAKTKVDRTPLHFAAYEGHADIVQLLLRHGVEVDCRDMLQMTPLHWAVERKHEDCAVLLLNAGADPRSESKFGKTPMSIALEAEWLGMWELLHTTTTQEATQALQETMQDTDLLSDAHYTESHEETQTIHTEVHEKVEEMQTDMLDQETESQDHFEDILPPVEESGNEATMQMLKEHGIMMIPADNTNTVTSAVQSGRQIVLSDAGKLILKDVTFLDEQPKTVEIKKKPVLLPTGKIKNTKIYTMSSSQFLAMTGQSKPNILSKIPLDIKKAVESGLNVVQLPQSTQFVSTGKTTPVIKTINVSNKSPIKQSNNITVMTQNKGNLMSIKGNTLSQLPANLKGELFDLKTLANQGKAKVIHLKNGTNLGNTVKIVVKKNNMGKLIAQVPAQMTNGVTMSNTITASTTHSIDMPSLNLDSSPVKQQADSGVVESLKSQLKQAREEAEEYKRKFQALESEMKLIKNKLNLVSPDILPS